MTKKTNKPDDSINPVRVVRVSRLFGYNPVAVLVHTHDGRKKQIKMTDWNYINADTGGITESGWHFIESEINRIFGDFEWASPHGATA